MLKELTLSVLSFTLLCSTAAMAQSTTVQGTVDYMSGYSSNLGYSSTNLDLTLPGDVAKNDHQEYLQLAAATGDKQSMKTEAMEPKPEFSERWFTANKMHQYLGIGSLTAAIVAGLLPKPDSDTPDDGAHHDLAELSAILGGAAVATGLVFHYHDLSFKKGFSNPDNLHALLASLGAVGYAIAVSEAPAGNHAGYGLAGAVLMLGGIKITW